MKELLLVLLLLAFLHSPGISDNKKYYITGQCGDSNVTKTHHLKNWTRGILKIDVTCRNAGNEPELHPFKLSRIACNKTLDVCNIVHINCIGEHNVVNIIWKNFEKKNNGTMVSVSFKRHTTIYQLRMKGFRCESNLESESIGEDLIITFNSLDCNGNFSLQRSSLVVFSDVKMNSIRSPLVNNSSQLMFRGVPPGSYTVIITNDCGEHFPLKNILNHYWNSSGVSPATSNSCGLPAIIFLRDSGGRPITITLQMPQLKTHLYRRHKAEDENRNIPTRIPLQGLGSFGH
ncbi:hypothetical protein GBAR_LOCUS6837 [Geodia barretti]|uniref:Uncharacterized protein n=2 Tax=Geodia barretti TaxID=519541 RepID=A0AA35RHF1_GEOBA|nr:hypothetical protein GBAR_LOCUS6837 [Geodia barretti]